MDSDKIKKYFEDELSTMELTQFEKELATNEKLAQAMDKYFHLNYPSASNTLDYLGKEHMRRTLQQSSKNTFVKFLVASKKAWSIAASITILFVVSVVSFQGSEYSNQNLASSTYKEVQFILPNLAGSNVTSNIHRAYFNEKWEEVIKLAKGVDSLDQNYFDILFLTANSHYNKGEFKKAIPLFLRLSKRDHIHQERVKIFLATTYLQLDQVDQTRNLLTEATKNPQNDFKEEAQNLLRKLNSFWRTFTFNKNSNN